MSVDVVLQWCIFLKQVFNYIIKNQLTHSTPGAFRAPEVVGPEAVACFAHLAL